MTGTYNAQFLGVPRQRPQDRDDGDQHLPSDGGMLRRFGALPPASRTSPDLLPPLEPKNRMVLRFFGFDGLMFESGGRTSPLRRDRGAAAQADMSTLGTAERELAASAPPCRVTSTPR